MNDASPPLLLFGDFRIDRRKRTLARADGEVMALTPKHFDTLLYLVENAGEVLEKDRMMSALWPGMVVEENNLSQAISQLRRILGDDGTEHRYILTVPRRGYRFVAEVRAQEVLPAMPTIEPPTVPPTTVPMDSPVQGPPIEPAIDLPNHSLADSTQVSATRAPTPARRRMWVAGAAFVAMVAVVGGAWNMLADDRGSNAGKSIAVMPFVNFSGDKADEFFSEGITEDLVTQLAQISELKVISRTSILQYRDTKKPLREIARELGVAHILQGSVRRGDNSFRITAQLIDPAKEGHLWAKSYDRDIKDVLAVQSEVTREIAAALRAIELNPGDADAWDILRATALEPTGRLDEAVAAQRRAVLLDPRNAAMAHRLAFLFIYERRYDEALKQARANLELDPKYLNNHVVIARAHEAKGEFAQALAAYRIPQWAFLPEEAIADIEAALAKTGAEGYWRARSAWQRRYAVQQPEGTYFTAAMAAQAGDIDDAFRELNRAIDARSQFLVFAKIEPLFDPLRGDARFTAALKRLNLH